MKINNKKIGDKGEQAACDYLESKNYQIIDRNYRFERGEIDIIASINKTLVFIEVKTRTSKIYGEPEYAIDTSKRQKISKIASAYLFEHNILETECRFDSITIMMNKDNSKTINHIENAF